MVTIGVMSYTQIFFYLASSYLLPCGATNTGSERVLGCNEYPVEIVIFSMSMNILVKCLSIHTQMKEGNEGRNEEKSSLGRTEVYTLSANSSLNKLI